MTPKSGVGNNFESFRSANTDSLRSNESALLTTSRHKQNESSRSFMSKISETNTKNSSSSRSKSTNTSGNTANSNTAINTHISGNTSITKKQRENEDSRPSVMSDSRNMSRMYSAGSTGESSPRTARTNSDKKYSPVNTTPESLKHSTKNITAVRRPSLHKQNSSQALILT